MSITKQLEILKNKINKSKFDGHVKSPINYTGNKLRILDQLIPHSPKNMEVMVDLFSGGATVGLNMPAKKVYFVDSNEKVINLLKHLASYSFEDLLRKLLNLIAEYGLSISSVNGYKYYKDQINGGNPNNGLKNYNEKSFYKLRDDYNCLKNKDTKKANLMLYLLMVYGFNNDIRFSQIGNFNLPAGKTDFNLNNVKKLYHYIEKIHTIEHEFICTSFDDAELNEIIKEADFIYMDPPYLITTAVYNESNQWNNDDEHKLLSFIEGLIADNKYFMLSNVIEKKNAKNEPLYYWTKNNQDKIKVIDIDYHYRSASYNKINRNAKEREVIIIPKRVDKSA